jgi:hypothetical protein
MIGEWPRLITSMGVGSLVLALMSGGCGGSVGVAGDGDGDAGPSSDLKESDFYSELVQAACRGMSSCCARSNLVMSKTKCEIAVRTWLKSRGIARSSDTTTYDAAAATACVGQVENLMRSCVDWQLNAPASCSEVFSGPQTPGALCVGDEDCRVPEAGESVCVAVGDGTSTCRAWRRGTNGTACQATCQMSNGIEHCLPQNPVPPADATYCFVEDGLRCGTGSTCTALADRDEACAGELDCARGLFCDSTQGVCVDRLAVGATCSPTSTCADSAVCGTSGHCETKRDDGEACSTPTDCQGYCTIQLVCQGGAARGWLLPFDATELVCNPAVALE